MFTGYMRAQSLGHHNTDRLEDRGAERGRDGRLSLKGGEGVNINQTNSLNYFKRMDILERLGEACKLRALLRAWIYAVLK